MKINAIPVMVLVDIEKVYDKVPRTVLWKVLKKKRVLIVYVRIIQDMYNETRTSVKCMRVEKRKVLR